MFDTIVSVFMTIIVVLSLMLNIPACYVSIKMRTELDLVQLLIVSISICDIIQSLLGFIPECIAIYKEWVISEEDIICVISSSIVFSCAIVVINHLSCLSVIRMLAVRSPIKYRVLVPDKKFKTSIIIYCYIYGIIWPCLPFAGWSKYSVDLDKRRCSLDWQLEAPNSLSYILSVVIFCYVFPVFIAFISTYLAISKLFARKKSEIRKGASLTSRNRIQVIESGYTRLILTMNFLFILSWMPYAISSLITLFGVLPPKTVMTVSAMCAKLSSVLNPTVNYFLNKPFRKILKKEFKRILSEIVLAFPNNNESTINESTRQEQ